ncbi:hydroxypyruvate isomerase [Pokkaliibacter plantistimulans]|uniref:Hydroxypyruvate isomerase n=2 Tax=Pseudomonadota TaxID=1224 RepID=A0A2S5KR20_9PROT|nr:hydroxypyruvate isomerase [Pokkaliibacter plantistimulans]
MMRLAANLTMLFNEVAFMQRFALAAEQGFKAVEFLFPYEFDADLLAHELHRHGLTQALFNMPPGDWAAGERGMAAIPGREEEFRSHLPTVLKYAQALQCKQVHAMAGIVPAGTQRADYEATFIANMRHAADFFAPHGIRVLTEPLNQRDMPGYFISHQRQAAALIDQIDRANVGLQFDCYHAQIMDGDLSRLIESLLPYIAHIQIASVPQRNEPDQGELNYPHLFQHLEQLGYQGWIGCEYKPASTTLDGLGWAQPYLS